MSNRKKQQSSQLELIPVMRPRLPMSVALTPFLTEIENNRIYSNFGPLSCRLSELLAEQFNVDPENVLLVTNGTLALQAAVATATKSGSQWTIPAWTFVASAQAVVSAGSIFELEDVNPISWTLDNKVNRTSDGVMVVAPFGEEPDLLSWAGESSKRPVIIDAASCFDSCRDLKLVNKFNISVMISLHATKLVSTGEGGVIIGPKNWVADMRRWINFGFFGDRISRKIGTNAKMSEFQAAIGLSSLEIWNETRPNWEDVTLKMKKILVDKNIKFQPALNKGFVTSTLIANFDTSEQKINAVNVFANAKIETRDWWGGGIHKMPAFETKPKNQLNATNKLGQVTTGLPLFLDMKDEQFDRIAQAVSEL